MNREDRQQVRELFQYLINEQRLRSWDAGKKWLVGGGCAAFLAYLVSLFVWGSAYLEDAIDEKLTPAIDNVLKERLAAAIHVSSTYARSAADSAISAAGAADRAHDLNIALDAAREKAAEAAADAQVARASAEKAAGAASAFWASHAGSGMHYPRRAGTSRHSRHLRDEDSPAPTGCSCRAALLLDGYCPVDFRVGRAVAMTCLPPRYGGAPDDWLVRSAPIDRDLRRQLLDAATNNTFERVLEGNDEVIKWHHDNGVPQVTEMPAGMFKCINMF